MAVADSLLTQVVEAKGDGRAGLGPRFQSGGGQDEGGQEVASSCMESIVLLGFQVASGNEALTVPNLHINEARTLPDAETVGLLLDGSTGDSDAMVQARLRLHQTLSRGGRIVVFGGPSAREADGGAVASWLEQSLDLTFHFIGPWRVATSVRGLAPYFSRHMAHVGVSRVVYSEGEGKSEGATELAEALNDAGHRVLPAVLDVETNPGRVILVVPLASLREAKSQALSFIEALPSGKEYPSYLDQLVIGEEEELRKRIEVLEGDLRETELSIQRFRDAKRILYWSDLDLEREVSRFLEEELGVPAEHVEGVDEDFWLVGGGNRWCIGEVKGSSRENVKKTDVRKLADHRESAGYDESLPGLLVANTFYALDIGARDQPVDPQVVRRGVVENITVTRTLDLIRLKQMREAGRPASKTLEDHIRSGGGGWLRVDADFTIELVRP